MSERVRRSRTEDGPEKSTCGAGRPLSTARSWIQAGAAQTALGFCLTSLGAALVMLARDLHVPAESIAWLASAFGVGLLVAAAAGPWLLRRGLQSTLRAGALLLAAGAVLLALASSAAPAIVGALLIGLGGAGLVLVTPALLDGPGLEARLTRVNAAGSTAGVIGPLALGALDSLGPSGRLALLMSVPPLLLLAATTGFRTVRHHPRDDPAPRASATGGAFGSSPSRQDAARGWVRVALAVSVEFCFTVWATARLQETGMTPGEAAALGSAFPIGMALGRITAPRLLQRLRIIPIGTVVTAAGALLVIITNGPVPVGTGLAIAGLGVAPLYPVTLAELVATPGLKAAHAASLGAFASGTAILLTPSALAALAHAVDLRLAFLITVPLLMALNAARNDDAVPRQRQP